MTGERKRIEFNTVDELAHACVDFSRRCRENGIGLGPYTFPVEFYCHDNVSACSRPGEQALGTDLEHG